MYFGPFNTLKPDHTYHRICEPHQAEVFLLRHSTWRSVLPCLAGPELCFCASCWTVGLASQEESRWALPTKILQHFLQHQTYSTVPSRFHQIKRDMTVRKVNGPSLGKLNEMGLKKGTHMDLHSVYIPCIPMITCGLISTIAESSPVTKHAAAMKPSASAHQPWTMAATFPGTPWG